MLESDWEGARDVLFSHLSPQDTLGHADSDCSPVRKGKLKVAQSITKIVTENVFMVNWQKSVNVDNLQGWHCHERQAPSHTVGEDENGHNPPAGVISISINMQPHTHNLRSSDCAPGTLQDRNATTGTSVNGCLWKLFCFCFW